MLTTNKKLFIIGVLSVFTETCELVTELATYGIDL